MPSFVERGCQAWFGVVVAVGATFFWGGSLVVHVVRPITNQSFEEAAHSCVVWGACVFKTVLRLAPWIELRHSGSWPAICNNAPVPIFVMNHTSFMDFFVFSAILPLDLLRTVFLRPVVQVKVLDYPFFGWAMRLCGAFPVHFIKNETGSFAVDKKKQDRVTNAMIQHIQNRGTLGICPEGQVSRSPPTPLQTFRRGSFNLVVEHDLPVWSIVMLGCHNAWPRDEWIGGLPSTIIVSTCYLYSPRPNDTPQSVAIECELRMQNQLDQLIRNV